VRKSKYKDEKRIKQFGQKLREIRKEKGVSQEALAYTTDLHLSQIGRIERGEINTSISFVFLFADTLGVEPAEFFNFENNT
jgi:transcriptional regulator with XRE-family HTH domain